jgi:hypothetical protein
MCTLTKNDVRVLDEIDNHSVPTEKDKESLQSKLNKQLNEEDHIYIFTEILQTMDKKIYTITENCTLFDLNDLDPVNFWKIHYHTHLMIANHERQKELNKTKQENDLLTSQFNQKMEEQLKKVKVQFLRLNRVTYRITTS